MECPWRILTFERVRADHDWLLVLVSLSITQCCPDEGIGSPFSDAAPATGTVLRVAHGKVSTCSASWLSTRTVWQSVKHRLCEIRVVRNGVEGATMFSNCLRQRDF
jgi:hypothetical protein